ncbi:MAG: response regulator transcription factor [Anaerolineae bacterium]|nr:response regulator transcription factor [Anaerolineae bacterium]
MTAPSILLVGNHIAWNKLLCSGSSNIANQIVQDSVSSKSEAIIAVEKYRPSLLVLDVKLKDSCGLALCQYYQQLKKPITTLILTSYDEDAYMTRALINGAIGYLLKTEEVETICGAIQQAMRGKKLWTDYQLLRIR